ncbi:mandelate racemase/muconate lactonizing enzyme family protein [Micromonospora sp. NPDC047707]|uniref:mandelate racemase/muconate lactonizing enzyme family protein n=1 Tax=Micromonospora sp. NPDC047707 TaxID=3154498 RepID=UPI003453957D
MRVHRLTASTYRLPMSQPWDIDVTCQYLIVTELESNDGLVGQGFTWTPQIGALAIQTMIEEDCRPFVEGGPVVPAAVWDRLWWRLREAGAGGVTTLAIAAVDIALWDLAAKRAGSSLVDLIGRQRDQVPVYASGVNRHLPMAELEEQARRWVATGHTRFKIKVGRPDLDEDIERVATVRRIIGPDRMLMIDANQLWDVPAARRAAKALSAFDIHWLEEPLPADDTQGYAHLRQAIDIPIATGESLYTERQFRDLLVAGGCDFVQPNVCRVGGITPFLRITRLARTFDIPVMPHLLPDISGQLALCLPLPALVEDIDSASFDALSALSRPSGVTLTSDGVRADTPAGHGLAFATDRLTPVMGTSRP